MIKKSFFGALVASFMLAAPVHAAIVTKNFTFYGSNFVLSIGDGSVAPIDPAYVSGSVTFDDSLDYTGATSGLTFSSNLPYTAQFAYSPGEFFILATYASIGGCSNPSNSFCTFFSNFVSSPAPLPSFFEQSTSTAGYYVAQTISASVAGVPEPASWALMIFGFGTIGAILRGRQTVRVAYA